MESTHPQEPQWVEKHVASANFRLLLALASIVIGIILLSPVLMLIGLGFAIYAWFTTPTYYSIYDDRLIIFYGRPRARHVLFSEVEWVDALPIAFGNRLRIRLRSPSRLIIQPKNLEDFKNKLQAAVERYQTNHGEQQVDLGG